MAIENQRKSFLKKQVFIFEEKAVKNSISSNYGQVISARYNLFGEQSTRSGFKDAQYQNLFATLYLQEV